MHSQIAIEAKSEMTSLADNCCFEAEILPNRVRCSCTLRSFKYTMRYRMNMFLLTGDDIQI